MEGQLAGELIVHVVPSKQRAQALPRDAQEAERHYAFCSSSPTADDSRFHDSSSRVSWRLPSRVSS